jgi:hypothetical protein
MTLNQIFLSPDGSRLRAGWRLALQTFVLLTFGVCLSIPIVLVLFFLDPSFISSIPRIKPEFLLLATIGETFAVTISVFLARRFLDKLPIESLGLKLNIQALFDVLAGIGITFLQMGFIFALMLGLGWLTFDRLCMEFDPIGIVFSEYAAVPRHLHLRRLE